MATLLLTLGIVTLGELLLAAVVGQFLRADDGAFERSATLAMAEDHRLKPVAV